MDNERQIAYWLKSAKHDFEAAEALIKENKYDWALFLGHLVLEKTLKAIFVQQKRIFPPKTHNLVVLIKEIGIEVNDEIYDFFAEVNTFHISTRYPDEQFKFYRLCTEEFTLEKFNQIKEKFKWLQKKLKS